MTPELIAFLRGRIPVDELPERIELPQSLWQQMGELWHCSIAGIERGVVQEHGGLLVLDPQDRLQLVNVVSGGAFRLQLCFERHEDYVGTFHTHPNLYGMVLAFEDCQTMTEKKRKEYTRGLKDDTALFEWVDEVVERQRVAGVPDAEIFRHTPLEERTAQSRAYDAAMKKRWRYHVIIASQDGRFRAHALAFPDIVVEADSAEAARKALARVLSHHLRDLFFAGKPIPEEQAILETLEVSLNVEPGQS